MKEIDLAKPVVNWLIDQHWDVYQEVTSAGGIADIMAVRAGKLWIIECKTSLTFAVLEQASHWRAHYRSIAVPWSDSRGRDVAYDIAHDYLKLGVLTVKAKNNYVNQLKTPPLMREYHRYAKRIMGELCDELKTRCPAGSISGDRFTPYRRTMEAVRDYIYHHPGCTINEIIKGIDRYHYANDKSAMGSIKAALENWESSWCEVKIVDGKPAYFEKVNRINTGGVTINARHV